jgi:pre-mRNA-splicing factor SYF2/beta-D-xylosidase 4
MESTTQHNGEKEDRGSVNSNVTQQDLLDSYMPAFQACVEKGRVSGLMCSYNAVNGNTHSFTSFFAFASLFAYLD